MGPRYPGFYFVVSRRRVKVHSPFWQDRGRGFSLYTCNQTARYEDAVFFWFGAKSGRAYGP